MHMPTFGFNIVVPPDADGLLAWSRSRKLSGNSVAYVYNIPLGATTSVTPRSPRMEATGQRLYKALLGVADTNQLLSIHNWQLGQTSFPLNFQPTGY